MLYTTEMLMNPFSAQCWAKLALHCPRGALARRDFRLVTRQRARQYAGLARIEGEISSV